MISFLGSAWTSGSICRLSVVGSKYESERESKAEKEGKVWEEDESVAFEDGGKHVDVEGDGGVGDNLDEEEIELHEGEEECEGGKVPLHHLPLGKSNPLFRQERENDKAENNPFNEVFEVGEVSGSQDRLEAGSERRIKSTNLFFSLISW